MELLSFWLSPSDGRKSGRANVKNENWLQKLIYRISDNKFNSFSLFSLQSLLHHISLPAQAPWEPHPAEVAPQKEKNTKIIRDFLYCCSVMNYTLALSSIAESVLETLAAAGWYTLLMIVTAHTWREIQVFISLSPFIQWNHCSLFEWEHVGDGKGCTGADGARLSANFGNVDAKIPLWSRQNVAKCNFQTPERLFAEKSGALTKWRAWKSSNCCDRARPDCSPPRTVIGRVKTPGKTMNKFELIRVGITS